MTTTNPTSASLLGVASYEQQKAATGKATDQMGKQDFLTLFTAQLKSQNPLDPVKNEAFVAQLAQFSQLEALTNMQTSLDNFVSGMKGGQMLNSTSLIGKKIAVADAPAVLGQSGTVDATIDLPDGASGVQFTVTNPKGQVVRTLVAGAQSPGTMAVAWDGLDANGSRAPAGSYKLTAQAVVKEKTTDVTVKTLATVRSVATNASDGSVSVEVDGGKTVLLKDIQRVGS